jgi:hypothetical protein
VIIEVFFPSRNRREIHYEKGFTGLRIKARAVVEFEFARLVSSMPRSWLPRNWIKESEVFVGVNSFWR